MKTITKEQVIKRMVKFGNNEADATKLVNKHFDYASSKYRTLATIHECIISIN